MPILALLFALVAVVCVVVALIEARPAVNWVTVAFLFFLLAWVWLHVRFDAHPYLIK